MSNNWREVKLKVITLGILFLSIIGLPVLGYGWAVYVPYFRIDIGMTEKEVYQVMGSKPIEDSLRPDYREKTPILCENGRWYGDCEALMQGDAEYYISFGVFIDTYLIVGFKDGKVVSKGLGEA